MELRRVAEKWVDLGLACSDIFLSMFRLSEIQLQDTSRVIYDWFT